MSGLLLFLATLLKVVPPFILLGASLRFKLRLSHMATAIILLAELLLMYGVSFLVMMSPNFMHSWVLVWSIVAMTIGVGLFFLIFKESLWKILFVSMVCKGYVDCIDLIATGIVERFYSDVAQSSLYATTVMVLTVTLLITIVPMWMLLKKLLLPLLDSPSGTRFWKYLWIYPMLMYLLNRLSISDKYTDAATSPMLTVIVPLLWTVASLASYFILLQILLEAEKGSLLQEKLKISDMQVNMQRLQYESMVEEISKTYQARHDLRHHVIAMQGYINSDNKQGLSQYLSTIVQATEEKANVICENPAVNVVLWHYSELARSKGVEISITVQLPKKLPIIESDFCVVVANLLENAVEAAGSQQAGERFITVKTLLIGEDQVAVIIKNSYDREILQNGEVFLSTKHTGDGIGTASVCRIARQYGGVTRFNFQNGVFEASVLLNC